MPRIGKTHQEALADMSSREQWEYNALEPAFQIAKQVIAYRNKRQLSQRQLAQKIGTSQAAICRIESFDYGRVTVSTLQKIASALDLDLKIELLEKAS